MVYNITLIPGDGIGPEITAAAKRVLEATGVLFNWDIFESNQTANNSPDPYYIENILQSIRQNKVALKGPFTTLPGTGSVSLNGILRKSLDLYALLRPCKNFPGVLSPFKNVDIAVVRENTEDLHTGIEFYNGTDETFRFIRSVNELTGKMMKPDSGVSLKVITRSGSQRIIKFAFEYARKYNRKKVSLAHKATVMRATDGLFFKTGQEIAKNYLDIEFEGVLIDNLCLQLVRNPQQFDVLVMPNLYGDIISDLCAGLAGGIGIAPGVNIGDNYAVFEAAHGSSPKHAGLNKANPMALMLSGVMMLRHLKETEAGDRLEKAMQDVIAEGKSLTYDLMPGKIGGVGTSQFADAVIKKLNQK